MIRKVSSLLLCLLLLICLFPLPSAAEGTDLVIMVYMTGSDLESSGGAASNDLEEMMRFLPDHGNIRIVAMISGSNKWRLDIPADETSVYEITREGLSCILKQPSRNMGSSETLADFLAFVKNGYPADRYGLIVWDHGAGPLVGVCLDEKYKSPDGMDRLTLDELSSALASGPFAESKLLFAGFDACLMATLEVAMAVSPYAEYMIASQETEPDCGWDYAFLWNLTGRESGWEIGRMIVSSYRESLKKELRPVTLSCLDLSKTDEVCASLGAFFSAMEPEISKDSYRKYTKCRSDSKTFGATTDSDFDLVDLLDLVSMYEENRLADGTHLTRAVKSMVVCQCVENAEYVNGISVYYPFDNKAMYESNWASVYSRLSFVPEYQSFIKKISDIFIGEALLDWKNDYQVRLQEEAGTVILEMHLSPEEMENVARSRLIVVEELQEGVYQQIYVDYDNLHEAKDFIAGFYHGEALYVVDESGEILAGPVSWYPVDNGIAVHGIINYELDFSLPFGTQKMQDAVKLIYHRDPDGNLVMTDIMVIGDAGESLNLPSSVDLTTLWDLILYNSGPQNGYESIASLTDYRLLDVGAIKVDHTKGAPRLAFLPVYGKNNRYAYIRITDMQGNTAISEVRQIPNPSLIPIASEANCTDNEKVLLNLKSADLVSGYDAGIKCLFSLKNLSDQAVTAKVGSVSIDSVNVESFSSYRMSFLPGEEDEIMVFISGNSVRKAGIPEAHSITVTLQVTEEGMQDEIAEAVIPVQLNTAIFVPANP